MKIAAEHEQRASSGPWPKDGAPWPNSLMLDLKMESSPAQFIDVESKMEGSLAQFTYVESQDGGLPGPIH